LFGRAGNLGRERAAKVDAGKARALYGAGWNAARIADEMG